MLQREWFYVGAFAFAISWQNTRGENPIQFPSDWLNIFASIVCVSAVIAVCLTALQAKSNLAKIILGNKRARINDVETCMCFWFHDNLSLRDHFSIFSAVDEIDEREKVSSFEFNCFIRENMQENGFQTILHDVEKFVECSMQRTTSWKWKVIWVPLFAWKNCGLNFGEAKKLTKLIHWRICLTLES